MASSEPLLLVAGCRRAGSLQHVFTGFADRAVSRVRRYSTQVRFGISEGLSVMSTRVRHKVLGMTVLLAAIMYLDRVCISVTRSEIQRDLGLISSRWGQCSALSTSRMRPSRSRPAGGVTRSAAARVLTRIVSWWSAFTMLTAAAFSFHSLVAVRFRRRRRGRGVAQRGANVLPMVSAAGAGAAQGIFFMGAHLAGGLTPLLVTALLRAGFGWRTLFLMFGSIGLSGPISGNAGFGTPRPNTRR